jgi:hypothetical protein
MNRHYVGYVSKETHGTPLSVSFGTKTFATLYLTFSVKSATSSYSPSTILSTVHELIPARNANLAAMHGSANGSTCPYYPT